MYRRYNPAQETSPPQHTESNYSGNYANRSSGQRQNGERNSQSTGRSNTANNNRHINGRESHNDNGGNDRYYSDRYYERSSYGHNNGSRYGNHGNNSNNGSYNNHSGGKNGGNRSHNNSGRNDKYEHEEKRKNDKKNPLLSFIPTSVYNPETKKILGFLSTEDLLLIALILMFLDNDEDNDPMMLYALIFILVSEWIDIDLSKFGL